MKKILKKIKNINFKKLFWWVLVILIIGSTFLTPIITIIINIVNK